MRRPLKYQIMGPMAGLTLVALVTVALVDVWLASRYARRQIESQWREIGETLDKASFPLTDAVLDQVRGLSGAEFLVLDERGRRVAATSAADSSPAAQLAEGAVPRHSLDRRVTLAGEAYFHAALPLRRVADGGTPLTLHCFYPETRYLRAWREAVIPSLSVGLTTVALVVVVSGLLAVRVTRHVARLGDQVERITRGEFAPVPWQGPDDELRDLAVSVNRLTEQLVAYENQVRRQERLQTLDQLGGGMAHQLRNSLTGCRLAIDFHRRGCMQPDDEALGMAIQQLELMEEYVRRFLALGKRSDQPPRLIELGALVEQVLALVRPRMLHLGVELDWRPAANACWVLGDSDALSQVMVNLLLNAAEAAAQPEVIGGDSTIGEAGSATHSLHPRVEARLSREPTRIVLEVGDTGKGPPAEVRDTIFEPLVSSKPDGAGLGLAVAREVVERHGGVIGWRRQNDWTWFTVELPPSEGK